jgi:hypothetical protein
MGYYAFFTVFEEIFHELRRVFKLEIGHEEGALAHDISEL